MNSADGNSSKNTPVPPAQDSTRDLIKLLISLASGVIAISAAFVEKLSSGMGLTIVPLLLSWMALAGSIYFGVKALSKLVHAQQTDALNWYDMTLPSMRYCWRLFQLGVLLLIVYASILSGYQAFRPKQDSPQEFKLYLDSCFCFQHGSTNTLRCLCPWYTVDQDARKCLHGSHATIPKKDQ